MKHARPDYDRFQDPAGLIPEDEPCFLIRGQDRAAPATLRFWADQAQMLGADRSIVDVVLGQAKAMDDWQAKYGSKIPDMP